MCKTTRTARTPCIRPCRLPRRPSSVAAPDAVFATRRLALHYPARHQSGRLSLRHCASSKARRHGATGGRDTEGRWRNDLGQEDVKNYEPGFVHIDIKYLPLPDETSRRYLFVAIDRATRWVFMHIYNNMTDTSSVDFLRRLKFASPITISKIPTDNGSQFTDRFTTKD
jgi:hypothetical protein